MLTFVDLDVSRAWTAYRRLRLVVDAEVARDLERSTALSMPDFEVLAAVVELDEPCLRVAALAGHLGWSHSRLSRQLGRMETRGLIDRVPCERDGRGDDVVLGPEGRSAYDAAEPVHATAVTRHFGDRLAHEDLATLIALGSRLE
ncbi:MarR family transcriptional regulator [Nocardia puris]|uniref:MarR family transcriptional regulator n=1 Tax=Nocardia puris TaxID=208602 RepID=A0A366CZ07_9NOCA|nr:MarR family transcriptional regulator [Nocardia puris]